MNQETAMRIQENTNLEMAIIKLVTALEISNDSRLREIKDVMEQARREEAPLNVGRTPEEVIAYSAVPRKVADYVKAKHPWLLDLANWGDEYFAHD